MSPNDIANIIVILFFFGLFLYTAKKFNQQSRH